MGDYELGAAPPDAAEADDPHSVHRGRRAAGLLLRPGPPKDARRISPNAHARLATTRTCELKSAP